jgi:hypothetical protein
MRSSRKLKTDQKPALPDTPGTRAFLEGLRNLREQISSILMEAEFAHELECRKCGSREVQVAHWVEVNSGRIVDQFGSWNEMDSRWCPDCGEHAELVEVGYDAEDTRPLTVAYAKTVD